MQKYPVIVKFFVLCLCNKDYDRKKNLTHTKKLFDAKKKQTRLVVLSYHFIEKSSNCC